MKYVILGAAAASLAVAAIAAAQPRATGGTAEYWMSAETMSGFAAQAMSQAGRSGVIGALTAGGGNRASHMRNLTLQLGSPRRPAGAPGAEHLPPAGLGVGPSLPLFTPEGSPQVPTRPPTLGGGDVGVQGRILIYWGCGERARAGQPVEIGLARLSRGQVPAATAALSFRPMTPPSATTAGTYGEWPNQRSRSQIPATGSLVGEHVVRGNYSPEIRFSLAQGQEFLPPVVITANAAAASGAVPVAWQPVVGARGYFLMATGARQDGTIVMWSSSEMQVAQMAFDYLSPDEVARLIQQRVLLGPQTTQCTVPAEVAAGVQGASLMLNAFGPEANFSHPARPANAPRGWAPDWAVKLRTRSTHIGILGMDMEAMMGRDAQAQERQGTQPPERRRRSLRDRLRDRLRGQ